MMDAESDGDDDDVDDVVRLFGIRRQHTGQCAARTDDGSCVSRRRARTTTSTSWQPRPHSRRTLVRTESPLRTHVTHSALCECLQKLRGCTSPLSFCKNAMINFSAN